MVDWLVLTLYLVGMVAMSAYLAKGQKDPSDYYVGGRNLPWWAIGVSTMATQTSAISFIGIPAFVALKPGGGVSWLQYELALPLAMIVVMVFLIPFFRNLGLISVYGYLEKRFDRPTRKIMSGIFLFSRGLATGVAVYASAVVLSVCLGIPVWACILIVGGVTVVYDTLGGMAAVVWSDVVQMVVLVGGVLLCVGLAIHQVGGLSAMLGAHDPLRLVALRDGHGLGDGAAAPMWGFLVGGLFLYISYYGVDQSQAQRALSAPSVADTKRSLVLNGLARFPLTLLYLLMGLAIGASFHASPELQAAVPDGKYDYLVPQFVQLNLPPGARGMLFAAILAAAMSSLDSALNSLSAATMRDFVEPALGGDERRLLRASKVVTVIWGAAMTGFAFFVGGISDTVISGINMIGSVFYGPILAAFLAGILDKRARGAAVLAGVAAGAISNTVLAIVLPEQVYWMWWNLTGLVVSMGVTWLGSRFMTPPEPLQVAETTMSLAGVLSRERAWVGVYGFLGAYFVAILLFASVIDDVLAVFL